MNYNIIMKIIINFNKAILLYPNAAAGSKYICKKFSRNRAVE